MNAYTITFKSFDATQDAPEKIGYEAVNDREATEKGIGLMLSSQPNNRFCGSVNIFYDRTSIAKGFVNKGFSETSK